METHPGTPDIRLHRQSVFLNDARLFAKDGTMLLFLAVLFCLLPLALSPFYGGATVTAGLATVVALSHRVYAMVDRHERETLKFAALPLSWQDILIARGFFLLCAGGTLYLSGTFLLAWWMNVPPSWDQFLASALIVGTVLTSLCVFAASLAPRSLTMGHVRYLQPFAEGFLIICLALVSSLPCVILYSIFRSSAVLLLYWAFVFAFWRFHSIPSSAQLLSRLFHSSGFVA